MIILIIFSLYLSVSAYGDEINYEYGSKLVEVGEIPYQVSIHLNYDDEYLCGGVIVNSNKVLTLAHCLYYNWGGIVPPIVLRVKAGGNNFNSETTQNYDVTEITFHDQFDQYLMNDDLAVIEISTRFLSESSAISLETNFSNVGKKCMVAGWNQETGELRIDEVERIDCGLFNSEQICVRNINKTNTLCKQSLGSALLYDQKLLGILSTSYDCELFPGEAYFQNVQNALELIGLDDFTTSSSESTVKYSEPQQTILSFISAMLMFIVNLFL